VPPLVAMLRAKIDSGVVEMLRGVPIFSGMTDRQLKTLGKDAQERTFPEGATVVRQGEKGIGFYLVLDGKVDVRRGGRRLASLGPGEFFGEMALFDEIARTADVVATTPARCLVLSKWEFWGFAMDEPKVLRGMMEVMARRLGATEKALSE